MLNPLLILTSLLYLPQVLSDDVFRPSAGEIVPGNASYLVNWNITEYAGPGNTQLDGIFLAIPNMTPPYTSTFPVEAPNYSTMTTTGYINMVFTEINPTSTTTTIYLVYEPNCCLAKTFTLGPYTVLRHDTTPSTPTPPFTQPPTQGAPPTQTVVSVKTVTVSSGITSPNPASPSPSISTRTISTFQTISSTQVPPIQATTTVKSATPTQTPLHHHISTADLAAVLGTVIGGVTLAVTAAMCWMQWKKHNKDE